MLNYGKNIGRKRCRNFSSNTYTCLWLFWFLIQCCDTCDISVEKLYDTVEVIEPLWCFDFLWDCEHFQKFDCKFFLNKRSKQAFERLVNKTTGGPQKWPVRFQIFFPGFFSPSAIHSKPQNRKENSLYFFIDRLQNYLHIWFCVKDWAALGLGILQRLGVKIILQRWRKIENSCKKAQLHGWKNTWHAFPCAAWGDDGRVDRNQSIGGVTSAVLYACPGISTNQWNKPVTSSLHRMWHLWRECIYL